MRIYLQDEKLYFHKDITIDNIIVNLNTTVCKDRGFKVIQGKNKRSTFKFGPNGDKKNRRWVKIKCERGVKFKGSKKKVDSDETITTTKATSTEDECSLYFSVYDDENCAALYIRKNGGCCWSHCGHTLKNKTLMREGKRDVPEESLDTAKNLLENNMPSSFVREWLKITTGVHLSSDSINSLRMSVMVSKFDDLKGGGKDYYAHMRTRIY